MADYKIDVSEVKAKAQGRWFEILSALASPAIDQALKASPRPVPCPKGTGSVDGFRIPDGAGADGHAFHNQLKKDQLSDGFGVLMWINSWSFYEALGRVNNYLNDGVSSHTTPVRTATHKTDESWKGAARACDGILRHAKRGFNAPVAAYLNNRGLGAVCDMGFASLLSSGGIAILSQGKPIKRGKSWVTVPALIGLVSTSAGRVGLNIVRVTKEGEKASDFMRAQIGLLTGEVPKKVSAKQLLRSQPTMTGGAVRFGKATDTLCVGEGLETMLAVASELRTSSVAAAGHANLLESVEIPDRVKRLLIFADKDRSGKGEESAAVLRDRVRGQMDVEIFVPPSPIPDGAKGIDWLDDKEFLTSLDIAL